MVRYWLDANIFIAAKNSVYDFDINTTLWNWLHDQLKAGTVASPSRVYQEILKHRKNDALKSWVTAKKGDGLCREPDKKVCDAAKLIANHVFTCGRYKIAQANAFSKGADAWVIAHAMSTDPTGTVVTFEIRVDPRSSRVKIPDVCAHFGVGCTNLQGLLRAFNAKL